MSTKTHKAYVALLKEHTKTIEDLLMDALNNHITWDEHRLLNDTLRADYDAKRLALLEGSHENTR